MVPGRSAKPAPSLRSASAPIAEARNAETVDTTMGARFCVLSAAKLEPQLNKQLPESQRPRLQLRLPGRRRL